MRVAIRVDASLRIGTGHVFRCLTLADALRSRGAEVVFVSRAQQGNLHGQIEARGYPVFALPVVGKPETDEAAAQPEHADWLEATWEDDAEQTCRVLDDSPWDWLVVDHYALDRRWEQRLRERCRRIMVIDDLADRVHDCDLLLDQNLGRDSRDYDELVPKHCVQLIGTRYALLRPEFAALRDASLRRRQQSQLRQLLISVGGIDHLNATGAVLQALQNCSSLTGCQVVVVMGPSAPWLEEVQRLTAGLHVPADVRVNVQDMAKLMANSDLAIGAVGSTSWERCCLGLPTLALVVAANQLPSAAALEKAGAALISREESLAGQVRDLVQRLDEAVAKLAEMSGRAAAIVDGLGSGRVVNAMWNSRSGDSGSL